MDKITHQPCGNCYDTKCTCEHSLQANHGRKEVTNTSPVDNHIGWRDKPENSVPQNLVQNDFLARIEEKKGYATKDELWGMKEALEYVLKEIDKDTNGCELAIELYEKDYAMFWKVAELRSRIVHNNRYKQTILAWLEELK